MIQFTFSQLRAVASVAVACGNDKITPILTGVHVSRENGLVTAIATDRYRIARVTFSDPGENMSVTLPGKTLTAFFATVKAAHTGYSQAAELHAFDAPVPEGTPISEIARPQEFTLVFEGSRVSGVELTGKYPPVDKLMAASEEDGWEVGLPKVMLNPAFLVDLPKLFHPSDHANPTLTKNVGWTFKFNGDKKMAPVFISRETTGDKTPDATVSYLVQPMHDKSGA